MIALRMDSEPRGRAWLAPWPLALAALVLGGDYAFKRFCSQASASELDFLLAPTAALVHLVTGYDFVRESGAGHVSREAHVIIAPACSGANFAIVAFTSLALGFACRFASRLASLAWLAVAAGAAYAVTLVANAARISLGLAFEQGHALRGWFSAGAVHRAVGVAIYLGALVAIYLGTERVLGRRAENVRFPLACYVAVTLATPLLGGAYHCPEFISHAAVVLGATSLAGVVLWGLHRADDRAGTRTLAGDGRDTHVPGRVAARGRRSERSLPGQGDAALVPRPLA
ncbi:MAG TPA: exosortase K [Polyangiaceae bacterium]|nr:exosortase K [Polyangiaceae bacterium]